MVYAGSLYGSPVAIKMLHTNVSDSEEFIHEITVMRRLRHPNIVLFLGATVSPDPLCIVTELVSRGALMAEIEHGKDPLSTDGMSLWPGSLREGVVTFELVCMCVRCIHSSWNIGAPAKN